MKKVLVLTPLATPLYPPDAGGGKTTKPFIYGRMRGVGGESSLSPPIYGGCEGDLRGKKTQPVGLGGRDFHLPVVEF